MLDERVVKDLRRKSRGAVIEPDDAAYASARRVFNAMIDRHPRLIVRAADADDVVRAVTFARDHEIAIAVRGGGHNGAGLGTCDGGLLLDLGDLDEVVVDAEACEASVGGGCTWSEVDRATHAHGLATPSGVISSTGVGGLTLGGGIGHLTRRFGLAIDNLLGVDLVLADGRRVHASADEHADLFWAVRGGGGNFGVVTRFVFRLHRLSEVVAGPVLWPLDRIGEVLRWYRDFLPNAPEALNGFFAVLSVPPAPPFPEPLHGRTVCGVVWCHTGAEEEAGNDLAPMRALGEPLFDGVHPMPYPALQSAFDPLYPPGHQWYWHGEFFREIDDASIAVHERFARELPTPLSTMHLYPVDGASHRASADATAFGFRDATWSGVVVGVDPDPAGADALRRWTTDYGAALRPSSAGGAYVNFMMEEGERRVRATYRDNYARLAEIKRRYDPTNLFRINQNIRPAPARAEARTGAA